MENQKGWGDALLLLYADVTQNIKGLQVNINKGTYQKINRQYDKNSLEKSVKMLSRRENSKNLHRMLLARLHL
jgi:hypothetical protein